MHKFREDKRKEYARDRRYRNKLFASIYEAEFATLVAPNLNLKFN
jgi:hypothetical protein